MSAIPELGALINSPVAQSIGWALLQFVWQGALVGLLTAITLAALRRSAADVRYVVATIALSLMLTIPVVTAMQGIKASGQAPPSSVASPSTGVDVHPSAGTILAQKVPAAFPQKGPAAFSGEVPATFSGSLSGFEQIGPWLLLGWTSGVLLLTLRLLTGWLWVQRLKTHGTAPARASLRESTERLARRLHVSRVVRVLESANVDVPTVIGWMKPVVLFPASALAGLTTVQLEAILAHELAHIRRHDYLVNLFQTLVETLLFYHPAVWWVSRQIRIERENCCDDLAVSLCGDPVVYVQALADLDQLRGSRGQLVMAADGGSLLHRVRRLLGAPSHAGAGPSWLAGAVAIGVILTIAGIVAGGIDREASQSARGNSRTTNRRDTVRATARAVERELQQGANRVRQGANELRRNANELRRGVNEARRGVNEIRRDAEQLRRRAPTAVSRAMRDSAREFARAIRETQRAFAMALHDLFPQIPPPPPLPPEPPVPPSPPEPPLPPEPPIPPSPPEPPMPPEPPTPPDASLELVVPPTPPAPLVGPVAGTSFRSQKSGNFVWSNDGDRLEVNYRGDIEFSDDDTDVKGLSPGGWLRIKDGRGSGANTVEFRADSAGRIERRFWMGTSERPFEPEGRKWLAGVLPRFIRQTGIGAEGRVARIYKARGARGVLAEISLIEGSWAKRIYFSELLKTPGLDARTVQQALDQAGREVDSDFELATLLISSDALLTDDATRKAYFDAARSIGSDFEKRRVFSSALKRGPLSPAIVAGMLENSTDIDSDFEQASLLIDIARLQPLDGAARDPFFRAVDTVASDFEHRRVLSAVIKRSDLSASVVGPLLQSAAKIGSDFELASLLMDLVKTRPIEGSLREPFFRAVDSIGSAFERGRVLQAVARRGDVSDQTLLDVIKATQSMSGNFESAQVLLTVAGARTLTREARDAYLDAAEKLGQFEQGQVLSALVRNERRR